MFGRNACKWGWLMSLALSTTLLAAPKEVSFSPAAGSVEAYDFLEVTVNVAGPDARNPFTDVTLRGWFAKAGAVERMNVEGFCDSPDGSVFRIRFMPPSPGVNLMLQWRSRKAGSPNGGVKPPLRQIDFPDRKTG
jgi:hypothetical protein